MNKMKQYDAIVILGLNIVPVGDSYAPTSYKDHDEYGMLAGEMNVIATIHLFAQQQADIFVFSTGTSQKTIAAFGPDVPTEAEVYSQDFMTRLKRYRATHPELAGHPDPTIILENRSVNTYTNIMEVFTIIEQQEWRHVAIMSARYHVPRVKALCELIQKTYPQTANLEFITSEDVALRAEPGIHDEAITAAYNGYQGKKRLAHEAQGREDIEQGRYVITEFQLNH
jgi:hypothetical protein